MAERRKRHRNGNSTQNIDESSPVIQMFRGFQQELDSRNDKYERIVKISRDITIESKRTIFLLHRYTNVSESADVLQQTEEKLAALENTKFREVAQELVGTDPFQYLRAYSPGLQEYIEALTFLFYFKQNSLIPLAEVQARLTFSQTSDAENSENSSRVTDTEETKVDVLNQTEITLDSKSAEPCVGHLKTLKVLVPPSEYILGIADLTGEMMRKAINAVGSGDLDSPFQICRFLQEIEAAYSALGNANRDVHRKLHTLRQSLRKVESACYTLKVRGSEVPKHMLIDMISKPSRGQFSIDEAEVADDD